MRKALIEKITLKIGDKQMAELNRDEAQVLFECLQDLFVSQTPLPLTIHQGYLYWIAPQLSWTGSDIGTSAFYAVQDRTLTLSLGLAEDEDKHISFAEAPALDAVTEDPPDTELVDAEVDAEHDNEDAQGDAHTGPDKSI